MNTGLRLGEVCALRISDFDFMNNTVRVERGVQRVKLDGRWKTIVTAPKSETSCRTVPIPEKVTEIIRRFIPKYRVSDELYLFTGKIDEPLCPRTCQHRFGSLLKRCGVRRRGFHTLRHTYATRCIEKNIDVKSISEILGHADVLTTMRYYDHTSMDYKKRSAELVSTLNDIDIPRACA